MRPVVLAAPGLILLLTLALVLIVLLARIFHQFEAECA